MKRKVLCKKDYHYSVNVNRSWFEKLFEAKHTLFKKDNYYTIDITIDNGIVVSTEFGKDYLIVQRIFQKHFYSDTEIRKLKLNKIKKCK